MHKDMEHQTPRFALLGMGHIQHLDYVPFMMDLGGFVYVTNRQHGLEVDLLMLIMSEY